MRCAVKPSLRAASCCRVEVVNGAAGLRLRCFFSTLSDVELAVRGGLQAWSIWRALTVGDRELVDLFTFELGQLGAEGLSFLLGIGLDGPVLARLERLDLVLALADQAQRRTLHATRPTARADLFHSSGDRLKPTR